MLRALGMLVLVARGKRVSLLSIREISRGILVYEGSRAAAIRPRTDQSCLSGWADGVLSLLAAWTHEEGLPPETGIPGFRDSTVLVSSRIGEDTVYSSTAQYRLEKPVSVSGIYTGTSRYTSKPKRPG